MAIVRCLVLRCDEEHGWGESYFPHGDGESEPAPAIDVSAKELRRRARKAGWVFRRNGEGGRGSLYALCQVCAENEKEVA